MIFDKACGVGERHLPELAAILKRANLFVFDTPSHMLTRDYSYYAEGVETYHQPFPVIAIEDGASLIVFEDHNPDEIGPKGQWTWWEVIPLAGGDEDFFREGSQSKAQSELEMLRKEFGDSALVVHEGGFAEVMASEEKIGLDISHRHTWIVDKKQGITSHITAMDYVMMNNGDLDYARKTAVNIPPAIEQVLYINSPDRFIVESTPGKQKRQRNLKKIPRGHQRPNFTTVSKTKIKRYFGEKSPQEASGESRRSPVPHIRRKHVRRLVATQDSRWKETKTIVIPAKWIGGDTEYKEGGKIYKVRTDL